MNFGCRAYLLVFTVFCFSMAGTAHAKCVRLPSKLYDPPWSAQTEIKTFLPQELKRCDAIPRNMVMLCDTHPRYCDDSHPIKFFEENADKNYCAEHASDLVTNCVNIRDAWVVSDSAGWQDISAGALHSCGIKTDGTLWCWGWLEYLGIGKKNEADIENDKEQPPEDLYSLGPVQEATKSSDWRQVSTSDELTCAVKTDGTLWCFGNVDSFDIDASIYSETIFEETPLIPVQEPSRANDWKQVSVSAFMFYKFCGIKTDNSLWCAGSNTAGELGVDPTVHFFSAMPVQEKSENHDWAKVETEQIHTCALKHDGTIWCWGDDTFGQLGNRKIIDDNGNEIGSRLFPYTMPVKVETESSKWLDVTAGADHTCALNWNGTIWCWGDDYSNLGTGMGDIFTQAGKIYRTVLYSAHTPVQEGSKSNDWKKVKANGNLTCAIKKDSTLWCWGINDAGQAGSPGDEWRVYLPTQEASMGRNWVDVFPGARHHSCGLKTDGKLYCWGDSGFGLLGQIAEYKTRAE